MSSKIGLILSMIFIAMFFMFGVDLICVQFVYSDLDAKSISISYLISQNGGLTTDLLYHIETNYRVDFTCTKNCNPNFGDILEYTISTQYFPLIISSSPMNISISRTAAIGYYGWKEISMSEIKGQILGIVLVLMIFAAIATTMTGIFTGLTNKVSSEVVEIQGGL